MLTLVIKSIIRIANPDCKQCEHYFFSHLSLGNECHIIPIELKDGACQNYSPKEIDEECKCYFKELKRVYRCPGCGKIYDIQYIENIGGADPGDKILLFQMFSANEISSEESNKNKSWGCYAL